MNVWTPVWTNLLPVNRLTTSSVMIKLTDKECKVFWYSCSDCKFRWLKKYWVQRNSLLVAEMRGEMANVTCWFHGSSFKGFSIVFPALWLVKVESSQKSNGMWSFRHFFAPYWFHHSRNNGRDKLRTKFCREKMFTKPHLKLLRWCSRGPWNQQ